MSFFPPLAGLINLLKKDQTNDPKAKRASQRDVDGFSALPENPFLVSFPRTGSHWLRMLSEIYFERPTLVRPFHYQDRKDYIYLHHHDIDLDLQRENVVYLYREPVATVYSQLSYQNENLACEDTIRKTTDLYARHVEKWLSVESFTKKKTVLNYESLQDNLVAEFKKLTDHLGLPLDVERLNTVSAEITRDKVKRKTARHDEKVVNQCSGYTDQRACFSEKYGPLIWSVMLDTRPSLGGYFGR